MKYVQGMWSCNDQSGAAVGGALSEALDLRLAPDTQGRASATVAFGNRPGAMVDPDACSNPMLEVYLLDRATQDAYEVEMDVPVVAAP